MAPEVAGSSPVSHPQSEGAVRSVAQLVEHRSPKPGVGGSIPSGPVYGAGAVQVGSGRYRLVA